MSFSYPEIRLRPNTERLLIKGHPWVYSGAVALSHPGASAGAVVDVISSTDRFIGRGYFNPDSEIAVRMLHRQRDRDVDAEFVHQVITDAVRLRQEHPELGEAGACRLIHGESDGLPGLIVDRYGEWLVVQLHTAGVETLRAWVVDALQQILQPRGIYERSDVGTRRADGLCDRPTGVLAGEEPPELIEFREGNVELVADVRRGQKTGFFLDQRDNRLLMGRFAGGRSVLNLFSYTGSFSAHAARAGATRVVDVDIALGALRTGRLNHERNGGGSLSTSLNTDVFSLAEQWSDRGKQFGVVVVDPPSLARRNRQAKQAMGVYTKLNRNAMRLVEDGGYLLTCSCSTRVSEEDFFQIVRRAASGARVRARVLDIGHHSADHPVDPAFPEGRYLKSLLVRVFRD
ncbi:MAG: class I SAM-dependent rRNA methyltransferase [Candidatus Latescibacterota bacterium]|nr:class I SAM-dependent rRNA methyltransferase [Candidatus Latescibacterota bacterium]